MRDAFDRLGGIFADSDEVWRACPDFYHYEPWDVPQRPQWVLDMAARDGVTLEGPDLRRCVGPAPHPFQIGYLLSRCFGRVLIAASQIGKSVNVAMEIVIRATGEIPFALRFPAGHDTGVKRLITMENIIRWGRRSLDTGEVMDHDVNAIEDGSWDCGTIKGVGVFPREKIVPAGSMIRLMSYQAMILQNWWPAFTGKSGSQLGRFIPQHLIDATEGSYGNKGFHTQERVIHLQRGVSLKMLSYEAQRRGLEGITVPTYLDEEPPKEEVWGALQTHITDWSLSETPWLGITWSRKILFPEVVTSHSQTFHACIYDSPYKTPAAIEKVRHGLDGKNWEIGARMWGIPTMQTTGTPYYDRDKINFWIQRFKIPFRLVRFEPTREWGGVKTNMSVYRSPGLLDTPVRQVEVSEEDERTVWRLYEERTDGAGYAIASDQAEGADTPEEAGDRSTAVAGRQHEDDPTRPVCVATLRSTLPVPQFAREVMYAARYFHNAMLAPENGRGSSNASFEAEARDWPHWFIDVMIRQSTRKERDYRGFCPTTDRRNALYERLIRNWLDTYEQDEYPGCPDEWILKEAAGAIVSMTRSGIKKCDHAPGETIDSLTAWGILLFIMQPENNKQIRYRGGKRGVQRESWLDIAERAMNRTKQAPVFLGEGIPQFR
jgi:hypothetical protein